MNHYFVTGTDTDVGKTQVAAALLWLARQQGLSTAALKPVAAGCELTALGWRNADALALQRESDPSLAYEAVNPVALAPAIAPHIAAEEEGVVLRAEVLARHCRQVLAGQADFAVVEGAGGWHVPLNDSETLADLARILALPVVLVVGIRLGCINHALLTAEAIAADGLTLAGWVANSIDPSMARCQENIRAIADRLTAPCLGIVPYLENPDPATIASHLSLPAI